MNYSKQAPNGELTVADQVALCQRNAGTRLIGAPDNLRDKKDVATASYLREDTQNRHLRENQMALQRKGFSILTVNRNRAKKRNG